MRLQDYLDPWNMLQVNNRLLYSSSTMVHAATLLIFTLALADAVIARPLTPDSVFRVPFSKRTLTASNGTFDHDKFLVANAQTMKCVSRNLDSGMTDLLTVQ